ncbi:MAG: DUF3783 domain-containing protein [Treponema sp.]|jgi:hypothetical protein|nr:DUF3783 domain-containing protein [Treponema sp.]
MESLVVFFHGFDNNRLFKIAGADKRVAQEAGFDPASTVFASSAVNNMEWKNRKFIREVRKKYKYMSRKES